MSSKEFIGFFYVKVYPQQGNARIVNYKNIQSLIKD